MLPIQFWMMIIILFARLQKNLPKATSSNNNNNNNCNDSFIIEDVLFITSDSNPATVVTARKNDCTNIRENLATAENKITNNKDNDDNNAKDDDCIQPSKSTTAITDCDVLASVDSEAAHMLFEFFKHTRKMGVGKKISNNINEGKEENPTTINEVNIDDYDCNVLEPAKAEVAHMLGETLKSMRRIGTINNNKRSVTETTTTNQEIKIDDNDDDDCIHPTNTNATTIMNCNVLDPVKAEVAYMLREIFKDNTASEEKNTKW